MMTHFASPERAKKEELNAEIELANQSAVVSGLLRCVGGLLAILNEQRQVIALNDSFLKTLGIENAQETLGLRLGEVLHCVHAHEEPSGCGTTPYCVSCGAAIAMVTSLQSEDPEERVCALQATRDGKPEEVALLVRAQTITIAGVRFILVFLQDISQEQQRAALERTFFHDINNQLCLLVCASEMLTDEGPSDLATMIREAIGRLSKEIEVQRYLSNVNTTVFTPSTQMVNAQQFISGLRRFFAEHPAARGKHIRFEEPSSHPTTLQTDSAILFRVLCNMIVNACEATEPDGEVIVWMTRETSSATFCVWNDQPISDEIAPRIFQRNFSTKPQAGRGLGTYSMKLFGERYLGGSVTFTSSEETGTIFQLSLPL